MALVWLGAEQITSLEDDAPEARVMQTNYALTRDATLEAADWSFAIERWIPAKDGQSPLTGAQNRFKIPSNIIRVIRVGRPTDGSFGAPDIGTTGDIYSIDRAPQVDHRVESGYILTNEDSISCKGIRRIADEGIYSNLFVHAFAAHLAMLGAYPITESSGKFNAMSALYMLKIKEAKSHDGLQGTSRRVRNRSLLNVR